MMTPQDIRDKTFEKAVFGGYDMAAVDDCLEELYEGYNALFKENATLKAKLKVLAAKIEEYRESEDAMRLTLLSAQKTVIQIEGDAKTKCERMLNEAEAKSSKILHDVQIELANEEAKLVEAKRSTAQYLEKIRSLCNHQLDYYDQIAQMRLTDDVPQVAPAHYDDTVKTIETNVAKATREHVQELDLSHEIDSIPPVMDSEGDSPTRPYTPVNIKTNVFEELRYGEQN